MDRDRVYPRASGGTPQAPDGLHVDAGLSPRERGNPDRGRSRLGGERSIPARAGEPPPGTDMAVRMGVYPRASGGTRKPDQIVQPWQGLSPRERGNPQARPDRATVARSIPARAGEPAQAVRCGGDPEVYPRASGGTLSWASPPSPTGGLSPRERGNQRLVPGRRQGLRSIPARAGEPYACPCRSRCWTVYPRASGGTPMATVASFRARGLSPRERGNPSRPPPSSRR